MISLKKEDDIKEGLYGQLVSPFKKKDEDMERGSINFLSSRRTYVN